MAGEWVETHPSRAFYYGINWRLVRNDPELQDTLGVECWCLEKRGARNFEPVQALSMSAEEAKKTASVLIKLRGEK